MLQKVITQQHEDIVSLVAAHTHVSKKNIFTFLDFTSFLSELLKLSANWSHLISIGAVIPEVAIAADRANLETKELLGKTPFSNKIDQFLIQLENINQPIYLSNPNRITGGNFSLKDINKIMNSFPDGLIIIDEYYFDFFGITANSLAKENNNVVVLRSFTSAFGIGSCDTGYAIASKKLIEQIEYLVGQKTISATIRKSILATIFNDEASRLYLKEINNESLRVATLLNKLGVQSRIVAGDFLLIRVKDPVSFGNFLIKYKIDIENLDGYPQMKKYMKYRIQSRLSNDKFLDVLNRMPSHFYTMSKKGLSAFSIRRSGENIIKSESHLGTNKTDFQNNNRIDANKMNSNKKVFLK